MKLDTEQRVWVRLKIAVSRRLDFNCERDEGLEVGKGGVEIEEQKAQGLFGYVKKVGYN
jgi:hypothetical protein